MSGLLTRARKLLARAGKLLTGPSCCYRQARSCLTDDLLDYWVREGELAAVGGLDIYCLISPLPSGETGIYFDAADPPSMCPGTIISSFETRAHKAASCEECGTAEFGDCCRCGLCCIHKGRSHTLQFRGLSYAGADPVVARACQLRSSDTHLGDNPNSFLIKVDDTCDPLIWRRIYNGTFDSFLPVVYRERFEVQTTCTPNALPTMTARYCIDRLDGETWTEYARIFEFVCTPASCCGTGYGGHGFAPATTISFAEGVTDSGSIPRGTAWADGGTAALGCCRRGNHCLDAWMEPELSGVGYCDTGECQCRCCGWRDTLIVRFEDLVKCEGWKRMGSRWFRLVGDPNRELTLTRTVTGEYVFEGTIPGLYLEEYTGEGGTLIATYTQIRCRLRVCVQDGVSLVYRFANADGLGFEPHLFSLGEPDAGVSYIDAHNCALLDQDAVDDCMAHVEADYLAAIAACGSEPEFGTPAHDAWWECLLAAEEAYWMAIDACLEDPANRITICEGDVALPNSRGTPDVDLTCDNDAAWTVLAGGGRGVIPAQ